MAPDDDAGAEVRRELIRQGVGIGLLLAASVCLDPVQRRNTRLWLERTCRGLREWVTEPPPRQPSVFEVSALMQEAREITRRAAP